MIDSVNPLPIGNALRVALSPPAGARLWNLLRKTEAVFAGVADPDAITVAADSTQTVLIDSVGLDNGTTYYYQAFYWNGAWSTDPASSSGVPAANYVDVSGPDPLTFLQERLLKGLAIEVARGTIVPGPNANGKVDVVLGPPLNDQLQFPLIAMHLESQRPEERVLGEDMAPDLQDETGQWELPEGWYARASIRIEAWTINGDTRRAMRLALQRVIVGNLATIAGAGMREPTIDFSDTEEMEKFNSPVYWTIGMFSCLTPVAVAGRYAPVRDIDITVQTYQNPISESIQSRSH